MLSYQHKKHPAGNFIYRLAFVVQTAALAPQTIDCFPFQTIQETNTQRNCPGAHPASCTIPTGSFPGVKLVWRYNDHHPPPIQRWGQRREKLHICCPL